MTQLIILCYSLVQERKTTLKWKLKSDELRKEATKNQDVPSE